MKYSLRSLMIVVAIAPPLLAGITWGAWLFFCSFGTKAQYKIEDTVSDLDLPAPSAPAPSHPSREP